MRRFAPWLVPMLLAAVVAPLVRGDGGDSPLFVAAGRTLLSSHWRDAFASSSIQVGPLQLTLFGSVGRSLVVLSIVVGVGVALLVVAAVRAAGVTSGRLLLFTGLAAVLTGLTVNAFEAGHPADAVLPLLWVIAAADARRGRVVRAAVLLGLGAGLETWSVLGLAVLVLAPQRREALRGFAVGCGVAAALFLPFVLGGRFEMLSYTWNVSRESLLALVVSPGTHVGWALRLAQGAAALGAGFVVARVARKSVHSVWLVPLAVVLARLALDPLDNGYYFVGVVGPALVGLSAYVSSAPSARLRRWSSPSSPSLPGTALKPPVIHEVFTPQPCPMHPVSTLDLEGCAEQSILKTDKTINSDVKAIFGLLTPSARVGFVAGERAWLRYRTLSCDAEASKYAGGTLAGVVAANCAAVRNRAHVKDLAGTLRELRA